MKNAWLALAVLLLVGGEVHAAPIDKAAIRREVIAAIAERQPVKLAAAAKRLSVHNLWFDADECLWFAGTSNQVDAGDFPRLVTCLADLEFRARTDTGEFISATYGPGIGVNVTVFDNGAVALWVYRIESFEPDATIEPTTFASQVASFSRQIAPDKKTRAKLDAADDSMSIAVHVCVDGKGKIDRVEPQALPEAFAAYGQQATKLIRKWKVKPFVVRGKPVRACARLVVGYPEKRLEPLQIGMPPASDMPTAPTEPPPLRTKPAPAVSDVTPEVMEKRRVAGEKVIRPSAETRAEMLSSGVDHVIGSFKICVDDKGIVTKVKMLRTTTYEKYDRMLEAGMRLWKYRPFEVDGRAVPVCWAVTFIYSTK